MNVLDAVVLVLLLPLIGAVMNVVFGRWLKREYVEAFSCAATGLSFLLSAAVFFRFASLTPDARLHHVIIYKWFSIGGLQPFLGLHLDALSMVMVLLISGIGFLVHVYSAGFMKKDEDYYRYFAFLSLFVFFMLALVLADNLLLLLLGWEGVGLCSYLLIGFWYYDEATARAGKKAFIVTRIGDIGLLSAILIIFNSFGSLDYSRILPQARTLEYDGTLAVAVTLLLLFAAMGKSAQLPLQVWLPDAMRGPTPVSALIHSATMVTAGIYLIARLNPFYQAAPSTAEVVAAVGISTALYGASAAIFQKDIKKVLAYSTISQLGLMFLALGLGSYAIALLHLLSQAFFKALLFLVAGCLIIASGEHDIFRISIRSPFVLWTFLAGALSLAAVPGTAGFFSKDAILLASYGSGSALYWPLVVLSSFFTSLYIFRAFFVVFFRSPKKAKPSPLAMKVPIVFLSVCALLWVYATGTEGFERFLAPVLASQKIAIEHTAEIFLAVIATISTLGGALTAYVLYVFKRDIPERLAAGWRRSYRVLQEGYSFDRLYETILVIPYHRLCGFIWRVVDIGLIDGSIDFIGRGYRWTTSQLWTRVDTGLIDGLINGVASLTLALSRVLRIVQTGRIRDYASAMVVGAVALVLYYMLV